jgi:hypothetical protein
MDKKKLLLPASLLFTLHQAEARHLTPTNPVLPDSTNSAVSDSIKALSELLLEHGVYNNKFARQVLYTWTTEEQIAALRNNKQLLTKSKSEENGYSLFDQVLNDKKYKEDKSAQFLKEERFQNKRFAWSNSWATVAGWNNEKYGQHLLEIKLKSDAVIGYVMHSDQRNFSQNIVFYDLKMQRIGIETLLKTPDRLAGVYFMHVSGDTQKIKNKKKGRRYSTFYRPYSYKFDVDEAETYREFIVMNEGMVDSWSYGTATVRKKVQQEIDDLTRVYNFLEEHYNSKQEMSWEDVVQKWHYLSNFGFPTNKQQQYLNLMTRYYGSLAFLNEEYTFKPKQLKSVIEALNGAMDKWGSPLESEK